MRWPLVSRAAYDILLDERDRLRARNDHLEDTLVGIQRVRHGMRETPRKEQPKAAAEAIPQEIRDLYAGFQSAASRHEIDRQCRELRASGAPWDQIRKLLEMQLGVEEEVA